MKKRTLKKYTKAGLVSPTGATVSPDAIGAGITFGTEMIAGLLPDNIYIDSEGNQLGSAASTGETSLKYGGQGAALGTMIAPGIGTAIGAGAGLLYGAYAGNKENLEMEKLKKQADDRITNKNINRIANRSYNWGTPTVNTSNNMVFGKGGVLNQDNPNANAELELQETFQLPDGSVGNVDGPSHKNGGIAVDLPEGTRIWSDKLKHNGKTFAKHTKPITSKIAKLEKQIAKNPVNSEAKENSITLLNDQLDYYFDTQETNKTNNEMKKSFRKGGMVKYANGGTNPYDPFNQAVEYQNWENSNKPIVANTLLPENTPRVNAKNIFSQGTINPDNPSARKTLGVQADQLPLGQPLGSTTNEGMDNLGFTPQTSKSSWLKDNYGMVGQVGSGLLSAGIQSNRINKLARPRTLADVRLSDKVANPNLVDYSAERGAIDRAALNAMSEAQRGFGSSASAQAFKNKARLNQLEGTGRSFQAQENANAQIKNQFLGARSEAAMKESMINNEIDKYNLENIYGFDTMKAGQKNAITANVANLAGQTFGKQTEYKNQLEAANILANQYDPSVINDMIKNGQLKYENGKLVKARNGGTIKKRSFKK